MAKLVNPGDCPGLEETETRLGCLLARAVYSRGVAARRGECVLAKRFIAAAIKRGPETVGKIMVISAVGCLELLTGNRLPYRPPVSFYVYGEKMGKLLPLRFSEVTYI